MYKIRIENCNNIDLANIELKENSLNIRYAMNGTGKSTIGKAIQLLAEHNDLTQLKTFGSDKEPNVEIPENINNVLLFNEDFINTIVFKESDVIENAFDVFIKSDDYVLKQEIINEKLKEIHLDTNANSDLNILLSTGQTVISKFTKTKSNDLKNTGLMKSITSAESIFKLPEQIKKFQPLMEKEYNADWVGWKNDGARYDDNGICPFCTIKLDKDYATEKALFAESYSKSNVKNIKEMLSYFESVKDYMDIEKYNKMTKCLQETKNENEVRLWITRFYFDLEYLISKIRDVLYFNSYSVKSEDISKLDDKLRTLLIDQSNLEVFNNKKTIEIIEQINSRINVVIKKTEDLKKDIGLLKNLIGTSINKSVSDINEFLDMSGINYRLQIIHEKESNAKAILKYVSRSSNEFPVDNIKKHLSWGERNAFALVLFMHYAFSKMADLVILDDPISSFDSTKKYAIINRLFLNNPKRKSLYKRTVLMLTHDFQPVIDFIVNEKPNGGCTSAFFMANRNGEIIQTEITKNDIKSLTILLAENASSIGKNIVHRVISLRKLLELSKMNHVQEIAYNILSCLLKGKKDITYKDEKPIEANEIILAEKYITEYLHAFKYSDYYGQYFVRSKLLELYKAETNNYYKLQVFRVLLSIDNLRAKIEDPLLKYIDEQFHVENDYIFYLDLDKYDIIPEFVIPKCNEFLKVEKLLT